MYTIRFSVEQLFDRCIASSVAHAVYTFKNPFFSYSQSWYGNNFSFHYGTARGTISFNDDHTLAAGAIREEKSFRRSWYPGIRASQLFADAPQAVRMLAEEQALEFLHDSEGDFTGPMATTVFWSDGGQMIFPDNKEDFAQHGSAFVELLMSETDVFRGWIFEEFLEENEDIQAFEFFYKAHQNGEKKVRLPNSLRYLKKTEGTQEGRESLKEIGIEWGGLF